MKENVLNVSADYTSKSYQPIKLDDDFSQQAQSVQKSGAPTFVRMPNKRLNLKSAAHRNDNHLRIVNDQ